MPISKACDQIMKKIIFISILFVGFILSYFYLKQFHFSEIEKGRIQVTTSFYPMYFFASQIGGDKISITNITPNGAEPHDYELTPQDIVKIQGSKLLVLNGEVETWANKIKENLKGKDTQILSAGENLATGKIEENGVMSIDPHVWLSPRLAKIESQKIAQNLENIDPTNSNYYKINLTNLENELDKIDKNYKRDLENCETRSFVTSHAAFGYLSKDYGLNQIAIDGLSPDAEPSLQKLVQITNYAKANSVKYIFFESLVSPKLSETIANEVGAKTLVLDPIEGVLNNKDTYLTLMAKNLQNLRIALQCK